jgi:hypothetical protein
LNGVVLAPFPVAEEVPVPAGALGPLEALPVVPRSCSISDGIWTLGVADALAGLVSTTSGGGGAEGAVEMVEFEVEFDPSKLELEELEPAELEPPEFVPDVELDALSVPVRGRPEGNPGVVSIGSVPAVAADGWVVVPVCATPGETLSRNTARMKEPDRSIVTPSGIIVCALRSYVGLRLDIPSFSAGRERLRSNR